MVTLLDVAELDKHHHVENLKLTGLNNILRIFLFSPSNLFKFLHKQPLQDLYQPSMAYLKKRSLTLKTVVLAESSVRRKLSLLIRSSTTLFTSSEKTATSRGRIMSCLSTLRILSQSSPSLGNRRKDEV